MTDETPSEDLRAGHDPRVPTRDLRTRVFSSYLAHVFGVAKDPLRVAAATGLEPGPRMVVMAILIARRIRYLTYCANVIRTEAPHAARGEGSGAYGLWQVLPSTSRPIPSPTEQARMALEHYGRR